MDSKFVQERLGISVRSLSDAIRWPAIRPAPRQCLPSPIFTGYSSRLKLLRERLAESVATLINQVHDFHDRARAVESARLSHMINLSSTRHEGIRNHVMTNVTVAWATIFASCATQSSPWNRGVALLEQSSSDMIANQRPRRTVHTLGLTSVTCWLK